MMVYFRKHLPEAVVNDCIERIVRHGLRVKGSLLIDTTFVPADIRHPTD